MFIPLPTLTSLYMYILPYACAYPPGGLATAKSAALYLCYGTFSGSLDGWTWLPLNGWLPQRHAHKRAARTFPRAWRWRTRLPACQHHRLALPFSGVRAFVERAPAGAPTFCMYSSSLCVNVPSVG